MDGLAVGEGNMTTWRVTGRFTGTSIASATSMLGSMDALTPWKWGASSISYETTAYDPDGRPGEWRVEAKEGDMKTLTIALWTRGYSVSVARWE